MIDQPILKSKLNLDLWIQEQKFPIHFVPTMGALHSGHKRLIEAAATIDKSGSCVVLVSIFINPLQFKEDEDFNQYPRDLRKDAQIAFECGANAIWAPACEDVFPDSNKANFKIKAPLDLKFQLCGAFRPNHFDGVATVVTRFLKIIKPDLLVLGEKDWQQLVIIKRLIKDFNFHVKVLNVPTIREEDGLACSSRNNYLSKSERSKALLLNRELKKAKNIFNKSKKLELKLIKKVLEDNDIIVEYLEIVNPESLQPVDKKTNICLLAAAIRIGKTRLIDHTFLMNRSPIVAIDGPAGAGKSTVTKTFAKKMNLMYLDTGAMYRAVTWLIQKNQIDPNDEKNISSLLKMMNLEIITTKNDSQKIFINEIEITEAIRSPEVTNDVSIVASKGCVRDALTLQQKKFGARGGLVAEGRDIGTSVFPDADIKIFLTASAKERAIRRAKDLADKGFKVPEITSLEKQIESRDHLDQTRELSPLKKAADAIEICTDGLNIEEVVNKISIIFREKVSEELWP